MSEQTFNTALTIVRPENVQMIAQSAPLVYHNNAASCQRCNDCGHQLLDQINAGGMTDELDQQCATYITKARNTVKKMNTDRSAITKLFDQIRTEFTSMENSIDPTKADTIPYQIQQARNTYAAARRAEEERRRREETLRQQREQAYNHYKADVEDDYRQAFNAYVSHAVDTLNTLNASVTLANYEAQLQAIRQFPVTLPQDWSNTLTSNVTVPTEIADMADQLQTERHNILTRILPQLEGQYQFEVGDYRDSILDTLPSKRAELQRMAQAGAEERQRIEAEQKARQAAEAQRIEEERRRREEEDAAKKKMQQEAAEVSDLFAGQAIITPSGYQPKASVKKRIACQSADGILAVISMWWSKEGQFLPLDELAKTFKKQITFCERLANDKDHPEYINSSAITYTEEIKAK